MNNIIDKGQMRNINNGFLIHQLFEQQKNKSPNDIAIIFGDNISIEVFRAEKRTFYMADFEYLGSKPYALGGVNIHIISVEHNTIFKAPNDKIFANVLQKCPDEAIKK